MNKSCPLGLERNQQLSRNRSIVILKVLGQTKQVRLTRLSDPNPFFRLSCGPCWVELLVNYTIANFFVAVQLPLTLYLRSCLKAQRKECYSILQNH